VDQIPVLGIIPLFIFIFSILHVFDLFYNLIGTNSILYPQTDIIDTYVFRSLVGEFNFSAGAAVGFYQSIFGLVLVLTVNFIVKKIEPDSALF